MPKQHGEVYSYQREVGFKQRMAYVAAGSGINQIQYIGYAYSQPSGALTSDSVWQIRKFTYDASHRISQIDFADGNDSFDNAWDSRTTYTYS